MRLTWVFALVLVASSANAYPRVPHRGELGTFLTELASAARRNDTRALRRLTDRDFTVGEELGRTDSLTELGRDASMRAWLAATADYGACYRTTHTEVQCELPDPGPDLHHARSSRTSIAMIVHARHGWKLVAFFA